MRTEQPTANSQQLTATRELVRKAIHVTSAVFPIAYAAGAPRAALLPTLALLTAVAVFVEALRARVPAARVHFERLFGDLLRAEERRSWAGATWMLVAFTAAVALFPRPAAVAAMWAVSVGDALAALVGRLLGRVRLRPGGKSLEGALTCLVATVAGAIVLARLDLVTAVVAGTLAALAEWPERPFNDNLRIVLVTGAGILLWRMAFLDKIAA